MRSLSSPAAVCAAARRRRVDARGDRARPGADRRKRSPSAGARAVFSSVVLNGDLNNARRCHRQLTAGWRRGGWDIATIACRALSTGNEDDESQEGEWSSRAVHPRITSRPISLLFLPDPPDARARGGTSDDDIIQAKAELRLQLSARDVMPSDAAAFPRIVAPERHHRTARSREHNAVMLKNERFSIRCVHRELRESHANHTVTIPPFHLTSSSIPSQRTPRRSVRRPPPPTTKT